MPSWVILTFVSGSPAMTYGGKLGAPISYGGGGSVSYPATQQVHYSGGGTASYGGGRANNG